MTKIEEQVNRRINLLNDYCSKHCSDTEPSRITSDVRVYQARALANADEIAAKGIQIQSDAAVRFIAACSKGSCEKAKEDIESLIRTTTIKEH
jgi:hypothetical protein